MCGSMEHLATSDSAQTQNWFHFLVILPILEVHVALLHTTFGCVFPALMLLMQLVLSWHSVCFCSLCSAGSLASLGGLQEKTGFSALQSLLLCLLCLPAASPSGSSAVSPRACTIQSINGLQAAQFPTAASFLMNLVQGRATWDIFARILLHKQYTQ